VFAQTAPNEVAATIDALRVLYGHLSDHDARYDFYEKCEPFCEGLEAQNFATLEALQQAIEDANEDAPETIIIGHYAEEVVSIDQHGNEIGHWRDRAFQNIRAAKGYRESYLHSCDQWAVLREQYNEMLDYYHAMQREIQEQLAQARILHLAFLAAGVGLGLVAYHLIF
jgi:hypothetical protein